MAAPQELHVAESDWANSPQTSGLDIQWRSNVGEGVLSADRMIYASPLEMRVEVGKADDGIHAFIITSDGVEKHLGVNQVTPEEALREVQIYTKAADFNQPRLDSLRPNRDGTFSYIYELNDGAQKSLYEVNPAGETLEITGEV
jgi:hypothetical protein